MKRVLTAIVLLVLAACAKDQQQELFPAEVPGVEMAVVASPAYADMMAPEPQYAKLEEHTFRSAKNEPVTTFAIDVDRASYANVRRYLSQGTLPPPEAVRIEEMINYFDYD